ncbi:hypothetical protein J1614_001583 [Plenodomus biglobosus]|nr:hypothetical protein J1614_001583 [Plenodomus biglobosus]
MGSITRSLDMLELPASLMVGLMSPCTIVGPFSDYRIWWYGQPALSFFISHLVSGISSLPFSSTASRLDSETTAFNEDFTSRTKKTWLERG